MGLALVNVLASGVSPLSLWLLGLSFFLRLAEAMMVGAEVLGDHRCCRAFGCCLCAMWWRWPVGRWAYRKHDCVARRAVPFEKWEARG